MYQISQETMQLLTAGVKLYEYQISQETMQSLTDDFDRAHDYIGCYQISQETMQSLTALCFQVGALSTYQISQEPIQSLTKEN